MKNIRISKKLLSMLTAGVLMATPVMGHTEENKEESANDKEFALVMQDKEYTPLLMEDYYEGVKSSYEYLSQYINYDNMQADLQCLYYLVNREYMTDETENALIDNGRVYETNFDEQKYENFMRAYNLLNVNADYNQSVIKNLAANVLINTNKINYVNYDQELLNKYLVKAINSDSYTILDAIYDYNIEVVTIDETKVIKLDDMCHIYDVRLREYLTKVVNENYDLKKAITNYNERVVRETCESLIDASKLCYNEKDRALVHDMFINYVKAYENGRFYNEYFEMVFKQLTTLNAYEKSGNAKELSTGARWLAQNSIGGDVMQLLRDDIQEKHEEGKYTTKELTKYFDEMELSKLQFILKPGLTYNNIKSEEDLAFEVSYFANLWTFVYDRVNDDIMKTFENGCTKSK